jgi:beta-ribofuranosylaminobenzene 5'-phosphate synthase
MTTSVSAPSRLHCCLLDLGRATSRAYGGAGFMLEGPRTRVLATRDSQWGLHSDVVLDKRAEEDLRNMTSALSHLSNASALLSIEEAPPQHVGLGTKTALILSGLVALRTELSIKLEDDALKQLSRRGGTSGIGVHGFFSGGFVVDFGHPQKEILQLGPSSLRAPKNLPALAIQFPIPTNWLFHLILPQGHLWRGETENDFFSRNTPIPKQEVLEAISRVYHDLAPAVKEGNLSGVREALLQLHQTGFKARELEAQHSAVKNLFLFLSSQTSCAIGMSSMGPLLYLIAQANDHDVRRLALLAAERFGAKYLGAYAGATEGYRIA